jgi:hypothetical protein
VNIQAAQAASQPTGFLVAETECQSLDFDTILSQFHPHNLLPSAKLSSRILFEEDFQ